MALRTGVPTSATINGTKLDYPTRSLQYRLVESKSLSATATGGRKQARTWWGQAALDNPGLLLPTKRLRHRFSLIYEHMASEFYRQMLDILAQPGPHEVSLWLPVVLTYQGDGTTQEYYCPWAPSEHYDTAPVPATDYQTEVRLTAAGTAIVVEEKTPVAYAAGPAPAGQAWWESQGNKFKTGDVLTISEQLFLTVYPRVSVYASGDDAKTYSDPFREPLTQVFEEA